MARAERGPDPQSKQVRATAVVLDEGQTPGDVAAPMAARLVAGVATGLAKWRLGPSIARCQPWSLLDAACYLTRLVAEGRGWERSRLSWRLPIQLG